MKRERAASSGARADVAGAACSQTVSFANTPQFTEQIPLNGRKVLQLLAVAPDTSGHAGDNYSSQLATRP